jgi:hypothetical protein
MVKEINMSVDSTQNLKIEWIRITLSQRFKNILFPINIPLLLNSLPQIGYIVPRKVLRGVLEAGEALAVKGNVELVINEANKIFGVQARTLKDAIDGFNELRTFYTEHLNPIPVPELHFVEFLGDGFIYSQNNPSKIISNLYSKFGEMNIFSRILGSDVTNFGIRLVPSEPNPDNPNWFDLRIEPQIVSSGNSYYTSVVWRNTDLQTGMNSIGKMEETIIRLIKEIEKDGNNNKK